MAKEGEAKDFYRLRCKLQKFRLKHEIIGQQIN